MEHEVAISHLRDVLGIAYQHVSRTNEPVIVRRYNRSDVALVPLWEWRWLKQIEAASQVQLFLADLRDSGNQFGPGAAGALSFNVMAAVAQYYSDNLRSEVIKGLDEKVPMHPEARRLLSSTIGRKRPQKSGAVQTIRSGAKSSTRSV